MLPRTVYIQLVKLERFDTYFCSDGNPMESTVGPGTYGSRAGAGAGVMLPPAPEALS